MANRQSRPVLEIVLGLVLVGAFVGGIVLVFTGDIPLARWWHREGESSFAGGLVRPFVRIWDDFAYGRSTLELIVTVGGPPMALFLFLMLRPKQPR